MSFSSILASFSSLSETWLAKFSSKSCVTDGCISSWCLFLLSSKAAVSSWASVLISGNAASSLQLKGLTIKFHFGDLSSDWESSGTFFDDFILDIFALLLDIFPSFPFGTSTFFISCNLDSFKELNRLSKPKLLANSFPVDDWFSLSCVVLEGSMETRSLLSNKGPSDRLTVDSFPFMLLEMYSFTSSLCVLSFRSSLSFRL